MSLSPDISIRGIRQVIPSGYVIGRQSKGDGQAELLPFSAVAASLSPYIISPSQGNIHVSGAGIHFSGGTLTVNWNAGTVTALGGNLSLSGGTLNAITQPQQWTAGTVSALGSELSISGTTLHTNYQAGTLTTIGTNLTLSSGTLSVTGISSGVLPLVNGDLPGPSAIADDLGQFIGVPI